MSNPNQAAFNRLRQYMAREVAAAPAPPRDVLDRRITRADVKAYDVYFIWGPGRDIASRTDCGHGYYLTDSCPNCDADDSRAQATAGGVS